jgi:HD-GYP domain-containing protein (c-di-GMP phosphodiesterase class II)
MAQEGKWRAHRALATGIDVIVFLSPVVASSVVVWLSAPAMGSMGRFTRLVLLGILATAIAWLTGRVVRRLLPLTSLLRLTMVFPDAAPSRFKVARSAGNADKLAERLGSANFEDASAAERILGLVGALASHDKKTRGHAERVRAYTDLLSDELGLDDHERDRLRWSALLHDVGKLEIATTILNKPGKPTPSEWAKLTTHPTIGARLAAPLLEWLGEWGLAIEQHHERFDGTGYPHGLAGNQISPAGRMVAVVDAFETMTSVRSYKKAMSRRDAYAELTRCAGSQFDPAMVQAFVRISLSRQIWAMGPLTFLAELPFLRLLPDAGQVVASTARLAPVVAGTAAVVAVGGATGAVGAFASTQTHTTDRSATSLSRHADGADASNGGRTAAGRHGQPGTPVSPGVSVNGATGSAPRAPGDRGGPGTSPVSGGDHSSGPAPVDTGTTTTDQTTPPTGTNTNLTPKPSPTFGKDENGVDLRDRDFSGMDLSGYVFNGADLRGANFRGANLTKANFTNADLRGADFTDANATEANFAGADVRGGTVFTGTNLTKANVGPAPSLSNDTANTSASSPVKIDVLSNDDAGKCPLVPNSLTVTKAPKHGSVVVNADHTVTYTPKPGFTGSDQFTYQVANVFGKTTQATVKVTVS